MITYSYSQFRRRPWRSLAVVGGVAIGTILFVALSAMGTGFREAARAPLADVAADVVITHPTDLADMSQATQKSRGARLPFGMAVLNASEIDIIRNTEGVNAVAASLQIWDFGGTSYVTVLGIDIEHSLQGTGGTTPSAESKLIGPEALLSSGLLSGRTFRTGDRGVAVADLHYARFFDLQPGATVAVDGVLFDLIGIVELRNGSQAAAANLYVPLADAQSLVGLRADQVDQVYVQVADAGQVDTVVANLTEELGNISVMTEDSLLQVMGGIGQVSARFSQIAAAVGLLGGLLLAWAALGGLVGERRVEIGVMKAIGWQSRHVEQVFLLEGFLLSLTGGLIGFLLGWGIALLLGQLPLPIVTETATQTIQSMAMVQTGNETLTLPARVDTLTLALAVLASVAGGTFASWSSARRAASLKPAQTLSQH
ncbi:MAG: FtsX-like permease family protein [Chloroflexi bacterium]|nr:MAG: FtsX-like permease family protein [Chloroflexota bacterium]